MGLEDPDQCGSVDTDREEDLRTDRVETQHLLPGNTNAANRGAPLIDRENGGCAGLIPPALAVICAFCGIAFYFANRPHNVNKIGEGVSEPRGARSAVAPTILVSIDGFRHEYLSRKKKSAHGSEAMLAPHLHSIATKGVTAANGMQPVVPTKTFPNHWSLVTGLYPESSGIVGNTMYDPVKRKWFHLDRVNPGWWHGAPIWQTLRQSSRVVFDANGTRLTLDENYTTACVFWPGSNVPKHAPDVFWEYDSNVPYEKRVRRVISLLNGEASDLKGRAHFVTLYFEGVDQAGHEYGPNSAEMNAAIEKVDKAIGLLLSSLGRKAAEMYNIVIVSDHGMTEISANRTIDLTNAIAAGTAQDIVTYPLGLFLNMTVPAKQLYTSIQKGFSGHLEHAAVYLKEHLPVRWHLSESRLITRVVTMAALGWVVKYPHQHLVPDTHKPLERAGVRVAAEKGDHGYDNTYDDMQAIFLAQGPAFRSGATVSGMRSIDVYEMLCHMFSARAAPNNGTLKKTLCSILNEDAVS